MSIGAPAGPAPAPLGRRLSRASAVAAWPPSRLQDVCNSQTCIPRPTRRPHHEAAATAAAAAATAAGRSPAAAAPLQQPPSVHILWDLDNISVAHAVHLPLIGRRLAQAVARHAPSASGSGSPQLAAYANERTLARLGGAEVARRALALADGTLVSVPIRKNSADLAMRGHLHRLALQQGAAHAPAATAAVADEAAAAGTATTLQTDPPAHLVIACATNDHGFADALRFAAARGCEVWAVCEPLRTRRRPTWASRPDYSRFPLPAAAGRCLVWDSGWLPTAQQQAAEAAAALEWAAGAELPAAPLPCSGGVSAVWHAAGLGDRPSLSLL